MTPRLLSGQRLSDADALQAVIARRDTLLALFDLVVDVQADVAVKLLRCVKHLTRDPSMLLPLYVRAPAASL